MKTKITLFLLFTVFINKGYSQDAGITNPVNNLIIHEDNRSNHVLTNDLDKIRVDGWSNTGSISSIQIFGMRGSTPDPSTDINYYYAENANSGSWYKDIATGPGEHTIYINVKCNYAGCPQAGTNSPPRTFTYVKPYDKGDFYLELTNDNKVKITLFADYGMGIDTGFYYRVFRSTTPSFGGGTYIGDWSQATEVIDNQVNDTGTYYYWIDVAMNDSGSYKSGMIESENRSITLETNTQETYVPDDNFENYLETHGMGNGIANDNYVTTSNINTITYLAIPYQNISDMTGIEDFTALEELHCNINQITHLDFTSNLKLKHLSCQENQITSLNISANTELTVLECFSNQLTELDLSVHTELTYLSIAGNQITSIDISNSPLLTRLWCHSNNLTSFNAKNGNNALLTNANFTANNNPNLGCIEVDDAVWSNVNWTNIDTTSNFSEDCSTLSLDNKLSTKIKIYPNPTTNFLHIETSNELIINEISLYNLLGKIVKKEKNGSNGIQLESLSKGTYIMKIITNQGIGIKRIVKE